MSKYYLENHGILLPNFSDAELKCSCCGGFNDSPQFIALMLDLQCMRDDLGFPLPVTSAYRCKNHPIERSRMPPGYHTIAAVDLGVSGQRAFDVLDYAMTSKKFKGVGINQTGDWAGRLIHLDNRSNRAIWSY